MTQEKPAGRRSPLLSQAEAAELFDILGNANPDPKTELEYVNAYTLLVAVVLAAQSTDAGVNRATRALFRKVRDPEAMLALGIDGLKEHIKTIGLYNNKAKHIMLLSEQLVERHGGEVPATEKELVALAGVGRKSANVILNEIFGQPTMPVDTHVFRVSHRTGLSAGKTPDAVERDLLPLVPPRWGRAAHHLLVLHGRYLCKARLPECWRCPVAHICRYEPKTPMPGAGQGK